MILLQPFDQLGHFRLEPDQFLQQRNLDPAVTSNVASARGSRYSGLVYAEPPPNPSLEVPIFARAQQSLAQFANRDRVGLGNRVDHTSKVHTPPGGGCQVEKRRLPGYAEGIKKLRDSLRLSQAQFAERVGVSPRLVPDWEQGRKEPGRGSYIEIGKVAGSPECWFFFGRAGLCKADIYRLLAEAQDRVLSRIEDKRTKPIKVIPRDAIKGGRRKAMEFGHVAIPLLSDPAAAGSPRIIDEQIIERDVVLPAGVMRHPLDTVCIKVSGDSMAPILQEGYIIAVDAAERDRAQLIHQMVVVKELTGDEAGITIKWLDRLGREYVLTPENKAYQPQAMTRDHQIIGRVIWWHSHKE